MSFITDLHDRIYSIITTLFPTKTELKNPTDIKNNTDPQLINGYAVQVLGLTSTDEVEQRLKVFERQFVVTFTRRAIKTELSTTPRKDIEKLLLEDQNSFIQSLLDTSEVINRVLDYQVSDDDGIEFIFDEQKNFAMIRTRITVKYYLNTLY